MPLPLALAKTRPVARVACCFCLLQQAVKDGVVISNNNVYVQRCSDFRLTLLRQWTIEESLR